MATLSPPNPHPSRPPPPFLFSGPPSGNASAASLNINPPSTSTSITTTSNNNNNPTSTHLSQTPSRSPLLTRSRSRSSREPDTTSSSPLRSSTAAAVANTRAFHSTPVFGQAHAIALEELRTAQIQLAQAWGRDVGIDAEDVGIDAEDVKRQETRDKGDGENDDDDDDDDDDEGDILVARRRREANERFFEKVRDAVRDVVGRLEGVAEKMGKLERESMEIWKGEGSMGSGVPDS